jgi:hypothetical protein
MRAASSNCVRVFVERDQAPVRPQPLQNEPGMTASTERRIDPLAGGRLGGTTSRASTASSSKTVICCNG